MHWLEAIKPQQSHNNNVYENDEIVCSKTLGLKFPGKEKETDLMIHVELNRVAGRVPWRDLLLKSQAGIATRTDCDDRIWKDPLTHLLVGLYVCSPLIGKAYTGSSLFFLSVLEQILITKIYEKIGLQT